MRGETGPGEAVGRFDSPLWTDFLGFCFCRIWDFVRLQQFSVVFGYEWVSALVHHLGRPGVTLRPFGEFWVSRRFGMVEQR